MSMGVYIKGMEMPTEDEEIIIRIDSSGTVMTEYALPISGTKAIPVPPHGRLIDADALMKMCQEMQSIEWNSKASPYSWAYAYESFEGDIDNAPTIIPAEEAEG